MKQLQMPLVVSNHILYISKVYELYLSMRKSGITDRRKKKERMKKNLESHTNEFLTSLDYVIVFMVF